MTDLLEFTDSETGVCARHSIPRVKFMNKLPPTVNTFNSRTKSQWTLMLEKAFFSHPGESLLQEHSCKVVRDAQKICEAH